MLKLQEKYQKEAIPQMMQKFGYKSIMAVPRIKKAVVNTGIGRTAVQSQAGGPEVYKKTLEAINNSLALICGQKPVVTKAKKSIAAFKTREGMILGYKVTLRGERMYDFLERLIHIALPRSRDFRGIDSDSMDAGGNLTIGIKECSIFPEVSSENVRNIFGLEVTVCTTAKKREEGLELLRSMGFPIKIT